ncbi:MAG: UDP-N-acetylmuramate--L-alanine ligase, partial [Candidatus Omnitrophica bacterium]|nr:UDP-N-acetylmuramate--L-alanine ligase [Candidatus Omnitrophota bacterium]
MDKHYYLIGIGGIGMSGIAKLLLHNGDRVSGSDIRENLVTKELKNQGARIYTGHSPENLKDVDYVIYSSAIKEHNPEIAETKKRGIPILKRAQALARLMEDKTVISIAGSHGKTTITSLISYLLIQADLFPTVAIGGILRNIDASACLGKGKFFVAEADESDGSFLYFKPKYSIITNIDHEHLDYYQTFEKELDAFKEFIEKTENEGCVFYCEDDKNLKKLLKAYKKRQLSFGMKESAQFYPKNIEVKGLTSEFDCFFKDTSIGRFHLALGGMHNISNALSAIALGVELGIETEFIKKTLANYRGARRRLEVKLNRNDLLVIDDYAHHPTEIKATLEALKGLKKKRIIAVFQPHRYSRTKLLLDQFAKSFDLAGYIITTDIYPAGEFPIEGINGMKLHYKIKENAQDKDIEFLPIDEIVGRILEIIKPGDLVVTLGAGDIIRICDELVEKIK